MAELKNDIGYIRQSLIKNDEQHKEIIAKIDNLGDTFAPIIAWTVIVWSARIIGGALVLGLLGLIAKAFVHLQ